MAFARALIGKQAFGLWLTAAVLGLGSWCTWQLTDGMTAFTWEASRRLALSEAPQAIRDANCREGKCGLTGLGPVRIVDFIYTRCGDICVSSGGVYMQLSEALRPEIEAGRVNLVSVSFDPDYDSPARLAAYLRRFGSPQGWSAVAPATDADLALMKSDFGIVAIDDGFGGYSHNAPLSVVDHMGRLVAVHELEEMNAVVRRARELLGTQLPVPGGT